MQHVCLNLYNCLKTGAHWVIKLRRMRWMGHATHMGKRRDSYWGVVGKRVGKGPFGRWRYRWDDNIKMDLKENLWDGVD